MKVTDGVLVADSPEALPEAVEQYMVDTTAHMIHAPGLIDKAAAQDFLDIDSNRFSEGVSPHLTRKLAAEVLRRAAPQLTEVDSVLRSWLSKQPAFRRWPLLKGPTFDCFRKKGDKGNLPHLDPRYRSVHMISDWKSTPREMIGPLTLTLSVAPEGYAHWQAQRSTRPAYSRFGIIRPDVARYLKSIEDAAKAQFRTNPTKIRLPASVLQGPHDAILIDTLMYQVLHWPATIPELLPPEHRHKERTVALFDYSLVKTEEALHNGY